MILLRGLFYYI